MERWLDPDWRARFFAWWEGYDLRQLQRNARLARQARAAQRRALAEPAGMPGAAATPAPAPPAADPFAEARALENRQLDRHGFPVWSVERARGAQLLWGDDCNGPSSVAAMVDAVRPFGLTAAKSVLDLSAGLGGVARAISTTYDTWVTGLEPSPVLARMAMDRSRTMGVAKKAPVTHYDPESLNQGGSFDLVLGDRILHRVRDKGHFLDQVRECTKPRGGVLIYDYVIEGTPGSWEDWNGWRQSEPLEVYPWTGARVGDELVQRNFDVRIAEDATAGHRSAIMARMRRLAEVLQSLSPDSGLLNGIARELALWWARLRVLGRGLNVSRFVAYRMG